MKIKKYWFLGIFVIAVIGLAGVFLTGWFATKNKLGSFPNIDSGTRLLVVSPHPDDEILIAGGIIQRVLSLGGKVEIVFLTNGDASKGTAVYENKSLNLKPVEFLAIGIQRMGEAAVADASLGLGRDNLIFLGYPDQGLTKIIEFHYNFTSSGAYSSPTTKYNNVPYEGTYKKSQPYSGEYLFSDLKQIIDDFKPTIVATTNISDSHPDHKTAFYLTQKINREENANWLLLSSLVHFSDYPDKNKLGFISPPKKLFSGNWMSFDLTQAEKSKKMEALIIYKSQFENPSDKVLFRGLDAFNEVFETN